MLNLIPGQFVETCVCLASNENGDMTVVKE